MRAPPASPNVLRAISIFFLFQKNVVSLVPGASASVVCVCIAGLEQRGSDGSQAPTDGPVLSLLARPPGRDYFIRLCEAAPTFKRFGSLYIRLFVANAVILILASASLER